VKKEKEKERITWIRWRIWIIIKLGFFYQLRNYKRRKIIYIFKI